MGFTPGLAEDWNKELENGEEKSDITIEDYVYSNWDYYLENFQEEYDSTDYYLKKMTIGPMIASFHIPENIQDYFNEIKEAYSLGFYRSSIALCRALLEMSLFDKLSRKGIFRDRRTKVINIDMAKEYSFHRLINLGREERILNNEKMELAHRIRKSANNILHLKGKNQKADLPLSEKDTFEIVIDTTKVIEHLYS